MIFKFIYDMLTQPILLERNIRIAPWMIVLGALYFIIQKARDFNRDVIFTGIILLLGYGILVKSETWFLNRTKCLLNKYLFKRTYLFEHDSRVYFRKSKSRFGLDIILSASAHPIGVAIDNDLYVDDEFKNKILLGKVYSLHHYKGLYNLIEDNNWNTKDDVIKALTVQRLNPN